VPPSAEVPVYPTTHASQEVEPAAVVLYPAPKGAQPLFRPFALPLEELSKKKTKNYINMNTFI